MSVAEFRPEPVPPFDDAPADRPTVDRTPPQDLTAEQCVLGGMLLSKDAVADVLEKLRPNDFYKPANQLVYDAILDLYGRGEPADAVTVAAALAEAGYEVHLVDPVPLHLEQAREQLSREPRPWPTMRLNRKAASIDDYRIEDFEVTGYEPHAAIHAEVAV